MGRESTLDEFGRDDDSADAEAPEGAGVPDDSADADGPDSADSDPPPEDADADAARSPAPVTCEWTPDGAACEACGATVERRWVDGAARVCADCKEW